MKLRRVIGVALAIVYSIACLLLILLGAQKEYEWMVGDDGEKLTICTIPAPADDTTGLYASVTFCFILVLFTIGAMNSIRARRVRLSLALSLGLFLFWAYQFFLRTLGC